MNELFLKIINMSISASWLVLAVLVLRLVLKKAPKWVNVLLWGIVAVRLICPFTIESSISRIPDAVGSGELVSQWMDDYVGDIDIHHPDSVYYDAAIGAGREPVSDGNPLMWLAYVLLCRDIELACDEKVIGELDNEQRADYTQALVACSVNRRIIAACPLAFGEIGVKERVKMVMKYRKPTFWVVFLSVVICMVAAVCFLTNPLKDNKSKDAAVDQNIENTDTEIAKEEENISEKMVSDIAYYLELSASGKEFRDADESDTNRIMSEYGQLLDGYSLIARESMKYGIEFVQYNISLSFTRK